MNNFPKVKISELVNFLQVKPLGLLAMTILDVKLFFLTPSDNMNEKHIYKTNRYMSYKGKAKLIKII